MAKFRFKHAVMSAGKSQELVRVHYNYRVKDENVLVLTPSTNDRDGIGVIAARSGERLQAIAISPGGLRAWLNDYFSSFEDKDVACILVDECQFFTYDDIFALKEIAVLENDVPVIAYGLKSDFKGFLFEGSSAAFVVAEEIHEIETVCAFCNSKALMNLRFENGAPTKNGDQIKIGGDNCYRPVCHHHFLQRDLRI